MTRKRQNKKNSLEIEPLTPPGAKEEPPKDFRDQQKLDAVAIALNKDPDNDPRMQKLQEISDRVAAENAPNMVDLDENGALIEPTEVKPDEEQTEHVETEPAQTDTEIKEPQEEEPPAEQVAETEPVSTITEIDSETLVRVVTDGQEEIIPYREVIARAQKNAAADKRLEEATEAKDKVFKMLEEVQSKTQLPTPDVEKPPLKSIDTVAQEKASAIADALLDPEADRTRIEQTLKDALLAGGATGPSKEDILTEVNAQLRRDQNLAQFERPVEQGGFADLANVPQYKKWVFLAVDEKIAGGAPDNWETFSSAAQEVRDLVGTNKPTPDPAREQKREQKKTIDVVPAAQAKKEPAPKEDEPQTPSEIIRHMAKVSGRKMTSF